MPAPPIQIADEARIALSNLADAARGIITPTLRLGVTGLSRAGKTVFITALVHNLLTGARLPGFSVMSANRYLGAELAEYPEAAIPRFAYEQHLEALTGPDPHWPESTRRISQIRLTLRYQSQRWPRSLQNPASLNIDIVDYPGEWLLDLPLLSLSFAEWSAQALARAERPESRGEAAAFLAALAETDPLAAATDIAAEKLASTFTDYLRRSRVDSRALSALPPGRFLMPGDLEGSPALTFAPLPPQAGTLRSDSLYAMLERRYEAYKDLVVQPFFQNHFLRLDRQIVLVDALRALNAGPEAVADLETALTDVLACFRQGSQNPLLQLVHRRIDRILFAATKADHLHSADHDRLEAIINRLVADAARRARFHGVRTRSLALAAVRATTEDVIREDGNEYHAVVGTPVAGERLGDEVFDGKTEVVWYPGELAADTEVLLRPGGGPQVSFPRFRPPTRLARNADGDAVLPYIRLDTALEFLLGDWLA